MRARLVVVCGALIFGLALAHASLEEVTPERNSVLAARPEAVTLRFSSPVELRFSLFKVYPLELSADAAPADLKHPSEHELRRLNGLAGALVSEVLRERGDEAARADAGVMTGERTGVDVSLTLADDLEPGAYVVMWRVLATDTHWTEGFSLFFYAP